MNDQPSSTCHENDGCDTGVGEIDCIPRIRRFAMGISIPSWITKLRPGGIHNPSGGGDGVGGPQNPSDGQGVVRGKVVDRDGAPIGGLRITVFAKAIRANARIGEARTDARGNYQVRYPRPKPLNLAVRASDAENRTIAESATAFSAAAVLEMDLTTAKDGIVREPSSYTRFMTSAISTLGSSSLGCLIENKDTHELAFLADAIGSTFGDVARLYVADRLSELHALRKETLFGILVQSIPAALDAAFADLPDAGLNATFLDQIMNGVLAHDRGVLSHALSQSLSTNSIPASYADAMDGELGRLDELRRQRATDAPFVRGKTPLGDLLAAGGVSESTRNLFLRHFTDRGGRLGSVWKALRADGSASKADLALLNNTLSAGELLGGNLALLRDTLNRLSSGELGSLRQLARLDQSEWEARLRKVDPQAATIPPVITNDTIDLRVARFAQALEQRFRTRFPTIAFAGRLAKAASPPFARSEELLNLFDAHPKLELLRMNIDAYIRANEVKISPAALDELKVAQRLLRLSPRYESVEGLLNSNFRSAQSIYIQGRESFVRQMTPLLGTATRASATYARAEATYAAALAAFGKYSIDLNRHSLSVMASALPDPDQLKDLPNLSSLFGSQDYCECPESRSILSPAAYLVDLMQFLKFRGVLDALLTRRPDLQYIALNYNNTRIEIPHIDLVNELLEAAIETPAATPLYVSTSGTTAERRAVPQQTTWAAYQQTAAVAFPLSLPFDLAFAQTSAYVAGLGLSLPNLITLLRGTSAGPSNGELAGARLGICAPMRAVITASDGRGPWERWGLNRLANVVACPKYPDDQTKNVTGTWTDILAHIPVFLHRSGLSLRELHQLLECSWVTGGASVSLQPGYTIIEDQKILSCNTDDMTFAGIGVSQIDGFFDRAGRFIRLWRATRVAMWQLDWALGHLGSADCDDTFLTSFAQRLELANRLGLPLEEVLGLHYALEVRNVTNHLGSEELTIWSTYASVFRNPALLTTWDDVFVDLASGAAFPSATSLGEDRAIQAICAALALSAGDVQTILETISLPAPLANELSLDLLSTLFRHARLASSLSVSVPDLVLWIALTETNPFAELDAAVEFLRRFEVLRGTGLSAVDLDYLLRHRSEEKSALAFTADHAAAVFASIREAIVKLSAAGLNDADRVHNLVTQTLATALHATANVNAPVLERTGILPLADATITALLEKRADGAFTHDASHFPVLTAAFTTVAKAARLFDALRPTSAEVAFLVQHAGDFNWFDPGSLPLSPSLSSRFVAFERMLHALALDRRQRARTPKLFDMFAARFVDAPADATAAIAALAPALDARAEDVKQVALALGAVSLDSANVLRETPSGALANVSLLSTIASVLDLVSRYGTSADALVRLGTSSPSADTAAAARSIFQAQYEQSQWFDVIQPVEDTLRIKRRDALVAFLLAPRPGLGLSTLAEKGFSSMADMSGYFLIDPEMSCGAATTRLLQASLSIQQFVQRCYLGLEAPIKIDASVDPGWNEWWWLKQFRLWQANRQVFLYPENYLLPELRADKSAIFSELESDLRQSNLDADAAERALENYLRKLVEISKLVVRAHYHETKPDGSRVLHVFARTRGTPAKWYYRQRSETHYGHGIWTPWETLNLDIASDHVLPVIWNRRLHLVWVVFKGETAQQGEQSNPTGSTAPPAKKIWAIEFAMSERRAGQWQPKRTLAEKMFIASPWSSDPGPPQAFQFRAFEDPRSNLRIHMYGGGALYGVALLTSPDDPLRVTQSNQHLPSWQDVDPGREPSFTFINPVPDEYWGHAALAKPNGYGFEGQDLVYSWFPGLDYDGEVIAGPNFPLNVLRASNKDPAVTITLLGTMESPHIIVPQQELAFDSTEPFFASDVDRVFFVQPHYFTVSSSPRELDDLAYCRQWATSYAFLPFYHPFARTFLRELEVGGIDRLLRRELQEAPEAVRGWGFNFKDVYQPTAAVLSTDPAGYPKDEVEFSVEGAYSAYNWELFYHAPMFIASLLMVNHRHAEAMKWLGYIFDPTDSSGGEKPGRYWRTLPLHLMQQGDWLKQQIDKLLTLVAIDQKLGIASPDAAALHDWMDHPYDPHRVARLRIGAYGKATVMKFLDNLIAWGDALFAQDSMESIAQAEQLYVLASMILGPAPDRVRLAAKDQPSNVTSATYASLKDQLDECSNALVDIENVIPIPPPSLKQNGAMTWRPSLPNLLLGRRGTLFFCIPPNDTMRAYWDTVGDRLGKIRNCKNITGTVRQLALYAPPISPLLLVGSGATGGSLEALQNFQPVYRFSTYQQRASELVNDVRALGELMLTALEKKDAEALSVLRAGHELDVTTKTLAIKLQQITEALDQVTALQRQKDAITVRRDFYRDIEFMNASETIAISLQGAALISNAAAIVLDLVAGAVHILPQFTAGGAGFGGTPLFAVTVGGEQAGNSASAWANGLRGLASILNEGGQIASTIGAYQRRAAEWDLQRRTADAELAQLDALIVAANDRLAIAQTDYANQNSQIANALAIDEFLKSKYTNGELYDYMLTRLTTVHTQAYQLAVDLAQRANAAYNYELGTSELFVKPNYWDSQRQGLLAAESLLFDLRRMEASYLDSNTRELELTRHFSLALTQPESLLQLRTTGNTTIVLNEELFDRDYPGHYFRRIRSVAITIPCIVGPYSGVNATLSLVSSYYRSSALITPGNYPNPDATNVISTGIGNYTQLVTSSGQNDSGLFELNLHDERWLPFEGKGAVSTWALELRPEDNAFDLSTITDVILHLRYTARQGGNADAVRAAIKPKNSRAILVSVRNTFAANYIRFLNPTDSDPTEQSLSLPLVDALFPFSNLGVPRISNIELFIVLNVSPGGTMMTTFGPAAGAANELPFVAGPGSGPNWTLRANMSLSAVQPGPLTLTLPVGNVPSPLATAGSGLLDAAKVEDVLAVICYHLT